MTERIQGRCPACGSQSLFLGSGGYVTCGVLRCPEPGAATDLLQGKRNAVGVAKIAAERQRQVLKEGWTPEHDDKHVDDEMALAAACYASPPGHPDGQRGYANLAVCPKSWPWRPKWWKPSPHRRTTELVKAGALIAAEIDRRERARG